MKQASLRPALRHDKPVHLEVEAWLHARRFTVLRARSRSALYCMYCILVGRTETRILSIAADALKAGHQALRPATWGAKLFSRH